jgi:hypothetical protein
MPSTILRVKRRRDEPSPPNTIQLQSIHSRTNSEHPSLATSPSRTSSKRAREDDTETKELAQLMGRSHLAKTYVATPNFSSPAITQNNKQTDKAIVFRKVNPLDVVSTASSVTFNQKHKRKLESNLKFLSSSFSKTSDEVESTLTNESGYNDDEIIDGDKLQVVDARLEMDEDLELQPIDDDARHRNKRYKMSIQMVDKRTIPSTEFWKLHQEDTKASRVTTRIDSPKSPQKKKISGTPILNPMASTVNTSLLNLHSASIPDFQSHLQLFIERNIPHDYINWQSTDGSGTIGHIIALHNNIDAFNALLEFDLKYLASQNFGKSALNFFQKDKDGRTVCDVAKLVGANGIVQILQSRGWDCNSENDLSPSTKSNHGIEGDENDNDDFVYDVYTLHHDDNHDFSSSALTSFTPKTSECDSSSEAQAVLKKSPLVIGSDNNISTKGGSNTPNPFLDLPDTLSNDQDDNSLPIIMNVRGGVGYWGQNGQLILDVFPSDHDSDSLEEDEYDSNRECCDANDYPEEDSDDDYGNFDGKNVIDSGYFDSYLGDHSEYVWHRFGNHRGYAIDDNYAIDSDSDDTDTNEFRYRAAGFRHNGTSRNDTKYDDSDSEQEYRGFMHGESSSWSNERIIDETNDAFDADLDIDSSS